MGFYFSDIWARGKKLDLLTGYRVKRGNKTRPINRPCPEKPDLAKNFITIARTG